jgi:hypothetical protein
LLELIKNTEDDLEFRKKKNVKLTEFRTVNAKHSGSNIQIDFMYLPNYKKNKNLRYCLLLIDVYSRKLFVLPTKSRENAIEQVITLIKSTGLIPENINRDQEFKQINLKNLQKIMILHCGSVHEIK